MSNNLKVIHAGRQGLPGPLATIIWADADAGNIEGEILAANNPAARVTCILKDDSENIATYRPASGTIMGLAGIDLTQPGEVIWLIPRASNNNWYRG